METMTKETMVRALIEKDVSFIGAFIVAVKTTGIFCRPGCPAKMPKLENIEFFELATDALHAGYRPCKRCRPMDMAGKPPSWVPTLLTYADENSDRKLRDQDLRDLGHEPTAVRRHFKKHFGMTFQAYSRARRMGKALKEIREGKNSVEAAMDAGFASDSGFRDAFERVLGSSVGKASHARVLDAGWIDTPLGAMLAAANDEGLCLLEFVDRRMLETQIETLKRRLGANIVPAPNPHLDTTERELAAYFRGELRDFTVPLIYPGSDFQVRVWKRLLAIPYGKTLFYGAMAKDLSFPGGQRAVGKANGDNRIAIIIPCHRVIKSDGTLCGYGGGMWRKQKLLELEQGNSQGELF